MEKRFQVFVSSTYRDLHEERQQVMQALLELDCIPAGMELFPASDEEKWSLITRVIDDCDYYIVILGGRYGSVDAAGISYTEREYDYAVSSKKPVLAFLHADPNTILAGKTELAADARAKLDSFRKKAEQRMCKYWKSPDELGGVVSRSLVLTMRLQPGEGWVRGRYAENPEEFQKLRNTIDELNARLEAARTEPPSEAKNLAQGTAEFLIEYSVRRDDGDRDLLETRITWDRIFSILGPLMFDEAEEDDLEQALKKELAVRGDANSYWEVDIDPDCFQTIKVQLIALGLIQKSVKRRSLKDTSTYWSLTPYGEHYLIILKAIPANSDLI